MKHISQIVICPVCENIQEENVVEGDKFSYHCKKCSAVIENNKPHILQEVARFLSRQGGNVCTGFGGLSGEISHQCWYKQ